MNIMNKSILTFLLLTTIFVSSAFSNVFVPTADGFTIKDINVEKKSINNICQFLGYNSDQIHTYMDYEKLDGNVTAVIYKVFTETIICVITNDKITTLSKNQVNNYLVNFNLKDEYDSYDIESNLTNGINNRSLSSKFCSDIFSNSRIESNSTVIVPQIGYELQFSNGYLSKFNSSDGLNKWSKQWKESSPEFYNSYEQSARKHWGNEKSKILNEINIQADAYSRTPEASGNDYIKFHQSTEGTINFKMLMVAHYDELIKLREFKEINHGRYILLDEFKEGNYKRTTYQVNGAYFTFGEDGSLVNTYTTK